MKSNNELKFSDDGVENQNIGEIPQNAGLIIQDGNQDFINQFPMAKAAILAAVEGKFIQPFNAPENVVEVNALINAQNHALPNAHGVINIQNVALDDENELELNGNNHNIEDADHNQ
jgi:hypothetical protein